MVEYKENFIKPMSIYELQEQPKYIKRLVFGAITVLTLPQILDVLSRQHSLNINTLSIQKSGEKFWGTVDRPTFEYWHKQKVNMKENEDCLI